MKYYLSLLIIFCTLNGFGQLETDSTRAKLFNPNPTYLSYSLGGGFSKFKNTHLGPLHHAGSTIDLMISRTKYKKWGVKDLNINFKSTFFDPRDGAPNRESSGGYSSLNIQNYWHKSVKQLFEKKMFLYVGVGGNGTITGIKNSNRYENKHLNHNNQKGFNANLYSLLSVMLKYRFNSGKHNFDFTQQISSPFMGLALLPKYGGMYYGSISQDNKDNIGLLFTAPHNMWGVHTYSYIDWRTRKNGVERNTIYRLGIKYNAQRINYETKHQFVETLFILGLLHKF